MKTLRRCRVEWLNRPLTQNAFTLVLGMFVSQWIVTTTSAQTTSFETLGVVRELEDVEIPARREGLISELLVRRGFQVAEGEKLAQLDSNDTQMQLNVTLAELRQAEAKARNDAQVRSAQSGVQRASLEMKLLNELGEDAAYLERFRSQNSLQRATAELESSLDEREQNQLMVDVKRSEAMVLENDMAEMLVPSPVDGIVRELVKNQGEWVRKGEAIMIVTRMDRLLVEGFLDSDQVATSEIVGARATVTFTTGGGKSTVFAGLSVSQAAPKVELDGKFPVWVEFENRQVENHAGQTVWLIRPGMKANLQFQIQGDQHVAYH